MIGFPIISTSCLLPCLQLLTLEHSQHHWKLKFGLILFVRMDNKGNKLGQEAKKNPVKNTFSYEIDIKYI